MASRKSCTHMTWAEAKASSGGHGAGSKAKKPNFKKVDHGKALVAKTVAKNVSQEEIEREKAILRREKKAVERAAAVAAKRAEEKERERMESCMKPFDAAKQRMVELCHNLKQKQIDKMTYEPQTSISEMKRVAECRELQLNEIMSLEAIYFDTNDFQISNSSDVETLQLLVERNQTGPNNQETLDSIFQHPDLTFSLQLIVDGTLESTSMTMLLLINITLPKLYPLEQNTPPFIDIPYAMVVDRNAAYNPDKPLESLAHLEVSRLKDEMMKEMMQILPDPCVYEVISSWLVNQVFCYTKLSAHAQLSLKAD